MQEAFYFDVDGYLILEMLNTGETLFSTTPTDNLLNKSYG